MATAPFTINEALPADADIVSQHPANARTFRDVVESYLNTDHDATTGGHSKVSLSDLVSATPTIAAARVGIWQESGVLKARLGTAAAEDLIDYIDAVPVARTITASTGLTGGGDLSANRTLALTGQALALHNLATSGLIARTGAGTVSGRTLTAGIGIAVTNGDGVSGNPTVAQDIYTGTDGSNLTFPVGSYVLVAAGSTADRNSTIVVTLDAGTTSYENNGSGAALVGTWRLRGRVGTTPGLAQRVA